MSNIEDFEIQTTLVLSTAHIAKSTAQALGNGSLDLVVNDHGEHGWNIHISREDCVGIPSELKALIGLARQFDCQWLRLDRDGVIESLPTYEW
jgi:hypothetical protein